MCYLPVPVPKFSSETAHIRTPVTHESSWQCSPFVLPEDGERETPRMSPYRTENNAEKLRITSILLSPYDREKNCGKI